MKIAIVGPGALGCLVAAMLRHKTKEDVWLFDHIPERAKRIAHDGIKVEGVTGSFTVKVSASADSGVVGICDMAVICVKSYSTEDACKTIKGIIGPATAVLTLQNGIGNMQILTDYFSADRIVGGVTNHGATLLGVGHVRHAGRGDTIIGRADGRVLGAVRDIAGVMTRCGLETKVSKDVDSVIWSKMVISVGINALTAVTRLHNGILVSQEEPRRIMRAAVGEAVKVVKRKRVKLTYDDPIQKVESVCQATAENISSMLQDIINGKRTEIDFINGAVVRHAKALGIPTPINEVLTDLVKTIEANYGKAVKQS